MRAVVQRVASASVTVKGETTGAIEQGFLVLLGIGHDDTDVTARAMAAKIAKLRIFEDEAGKMNRALPAVDGAVLAISQFTLFGDARKGNRPSFAAAARPEHAEPLYNIFCEALTGLGIPTARGVFGAHMDVTLVNDGPVTLLLEIE